MRIRFHLFAFVCALIFFLPFLRLAPPIFLFCMLTYLNVFAVSLLSSKGSLDRLCHWIVALPATALAALFVFYFLLYVRILFLLHLSLTLISLGLIQRKISENSPFYKRSFIAFLLLYLLSALLIPLSLVIAYLLLFEVLLGWHLFHWIILFLSLLFFLLFRLFFWRRRALPLFFFPALLSVLEGSFLIATVVPLPTAFKGNFKEASAVKVIYRLNGKSLPEPTKIAVDADEHFLFFTTHPGRNRAPYPSLYRIDLTDTERVRKLKGWGSRDLLVDQERDRVLVAEHDGHNLLVTGVEPFAVKERISLVQLEKREVGDLRVLALRGETPDNLLLDVQRRKLFLITETGKLYLFDSDTLHLKKSRDISGLACSSALDRATGDLILAFCPSLFFPFTALMRLDGRSLQVKRVRQGLLWHSQGIDFDPIKRELLLPDLLTGKVKIVDADTFKVKKSYFAGRGLREAAFIPSMPYLLVGNFKKGTVLLIDRNTGRIVREFFVGRFIRGITITAKSHRMFVASHSGILEIVGLPEMKTIPRTGKKVEGGDR